MKEIKRRRIAFPPFLLFMLLLGGWCVKRPQRPCKVPFPVFAVQEGSGNGLFGAEITVTDGTTERTAVTDFRGYAEFLLEAGKAYCVSAAPPDGYIGGQTVRVCLDVHGGLRIDGAEADEWFIPYTVRTV